MSAGIADGGRMDAVAEFPELALCTPETAEAKHRLLEAGWIGRLQLAAVDEMRGGGRNRVGTARQRFGCTRQSGGLAHEQHGVPPGRTSADATTASAGWPSIVGPLIYVFYAGSRSPVTPPPRAGGSVPRIADQRLARSEPDHEQNADHAQHRKNRLIHQDLDYAVPKPGR